MTGFRRRIIIPVSLSEVFNFYCNSCSFFLMAYLNFWSFCICNLNNEFTSQSSNASLLDWGKNITMHDLEMVVEGIQYRFYFLFSYISWAFWNYMELTLYFLICVIYCEIGLLLIDIAIIKYLAIEKTGVFRVGIIYTYNFWFLMKYCSFLLVVLLS